MVVVFLKARARHFGQEGIPIEVILSPLAPEEGWRRAAIKFMEARWEEKQRGERPNWRAPPERQSMGLMASASQFNESY